MVSEELNEKLKSKAFKEKKKILIEGGFKLPREVEAANSWGPAEIRQRTEVISELAYNSVWKL